MGSLWSYVFEDSQQDEVNATEAVGAEQYAELVGDTIVPGSYVTVVDSVDLSQKLPLTAEIPRTATLMRVVQVDNGDGTTKVTFLDAAPRNESWPPSDPDPMIPNPTYSGPPRDGQWVTSAHVRPLRLSDTRLLARAAVAERRRQDPPEDPFSFFGSWSWSEGCPPRGRSSSIYIRGRTCHHPTIRFLHIEGPWTSLEFKGSGTVVEEKEVLRFQVRVADSCELDEDSNEEEENGETNSIDPRSGVVVLRRCGSGPRFKMRLEIESGLDRFLSRLDGVGSYRKESMFEGLTMK